MLRRHFLPFLMSAAVLPAQVRAPAVAGSFYPGDAKQLAAMVDGLIAKAGPPQVREPVTALVEPHAGYEYSGPVAAYGYALVKGQQYDRVVVIAPSHVEGFNFVSIYDGDAYHTPLGAVPVDKALCKKLANGRSLRLSKQGHAVDGGRGEHALEVQLPFLQRSVGSFQLVPIIMGDQSYEACRALGLALARELRGTRTLIVASSDLSHYHPYDDAVKRDRKTLRAIEEWDYLSMSDNFARGTWEACGGGPIVAAMIASERLGANEPKLLKYANSGDTTGDRSRVVGYSSFAFVKPAKPSAEAGARFSLSGPEKDELMTLARRSVEFAVKNHRLLDLPSLKFDALYQERGAFVTLKKQGELRGCIGYVSPLKPLAVTVRDVAAAAAMEDPRFNPVEPAELSALQYEISVLSPLHRVLDVNAIQVGRHGLIMKKGERMGLLLPQVPMEQHWDRAEFLRQTCLKAGLPAEAWRDPETDIFSFTALVF